MTYQAPTKYELFEATQTIETDNEKASRQFKEEFGGSIVQDLYETALYQRDLRIESQHYSERG